MPKKITTKKVCEQYGIDRLTLNRWLKAGCPTSGKAKTGKRGMPSWLFNPATLAAWALSHGKNPKGLIGAALQSAQPSTAPSQRLEMESANPDLIRKQGLVGSLERARQQEVVLSVALARAHKERRPPNEMASLSAAKMKLLPELRQLEMAALEYQKRTGELCDYSEMKRLFVELAAGTRERVVAVANQLVPVLRPYLKDPDESGAVRDAIDEAIRHALTALPKELPEK